MSYILEAIGFRGTLRWEFEYQHSPMQYANNYFSKMNMTWEKQSDGSFTSQAGMTKFRVFEGTVPKDQLAPFRLRYKESPISYLKRADSGV